MPIPKIMISNTKQMTQAQQLPQQQGRLRYPLPRIIGRRTGPGRIIGLPLPLRSSITKNRLDNYFLSLLELQNPSTL